MGECKLLGFKEVLMDVRCWKNVLTYQPSPTSLPAAFEASSSGWTAQELLCSW